MSIKFLALLFLLGLTPTVNAVEPSSAAKTMLAELAIKESSTPISTNPDWRKPERIVLLAGGMLGDVSPETLAALTSAADGAELIIIENVNQNAEVVNNADVLLGFCRELKPGMSRLRWVQYFSAGVESCVDNPVFSEDKILLTNMKGVYAPGIAEHVIAMMFSLSRGLHQFNQAQSKRNWNRALAREYPLKELRGKTILVVGLGGIGTAIAWRAHALGMRVIATRNSSRDKPDFVAHVGLSDELLTLAKQADVVVNSTPLTSATTGLFDSEFFDALKSSAYFINIGRGKSVVTKDLVSALETGKLAGAALDVVDPEPLPKNHALWLMPNVIITPHISGRSDLVMDRFWIFVRENLRRYVQGERMLNVVDIQKGY